MNAQEAEVLDVESHKSDRRFSDHLHRRNGDGRRGRQGAARTALVIGNADYKTSPLINPVNDARAMARTLRKLGFDVIERINVDQAGMKRAIWDYGKKLRQGGVGLFYFAGHGVQVAGENYLIRSRRGSRASPTSSSKGCA